MNRPLHHGGLCQTCVHVRTITSARGSMFLLCTRAASDARFPKYPPQPVWACRGHEEASPDGRCGRGLRSSEADGGTAGT
jgi:hypothetical protein